MFNIIVDLLKVNPLYRPTCDQIINNPIVRLNSKIVNIPIKKSTDELLKTIKLPKDLGALREKLPKPNYNIVNKSFEKEETVEKENNKSIFHFNYILNFLKKLALKMQKRVYSADVKKNFKYLQKDPTIVEESLNKNLKEYKKIEKSQQKIPQSYEHNNITLG